MLNYQKILPATFNNGFNLDNGVSNNLLAGRKAFAQRDASKESKESTKENPFQRKSSEKDLKPLRKSAGQLKTTSSKTTLVDATNKVPSIK